MEMEEMNKRGKAKRKKIQRKYNNREGEKI